MTPGNGGEMPDATLTVPAGWTNDCQGKKNYDGVLVRLSTRYWPGWGGFVLGTWQGERPSAHARIYLGEDLELVGQEFEADTQEEVQRAVEAWASEQYQRIAEVLRVALTPVPPTREETE